MKNPLWISICLNELIIHLKTIESDYEIFYSTSPKSDSHSEYLFLQICHFSEVSLFQS